MDNPELVALKKAMDEGAIEELAEQGFSKNNIVAIIEKAYPNSGIKANDKGGFDCPFGHGEAQDVYNSFVDKLSKVETADRTALIEQVKELNAEIDANNVKLDNLKGAIQSIQKEIEGLIEAAIKDSEEIQEDQKEESAKIVKEELDKYASSEGEITYDDFQNNISDRLNTLAGSTDSKLSSVVLRMINAEGKMGVLKGYMDSFKTLVDANADLAEQVETLRAAAASADDGCEDCEAKRCDPIGFTVNGVKYDFFVDKDEDGKLSNETEFLGAKDGWAEMTALDTDGDGKVSVSEMGDLKVVVTGADGKQEVKDAKDVLGADDSVDLNSYKAVNQDFEDGNTLLGTFSMTFNGQEVKDAYNTMDKLSWLDENYEFSDEDKGINRFAKDNTETNDIIDYSKELDDFNAKYTELEGKLEDTWSKVGITRADVVKTIMAAESEAASKEAKEIEKLLKKKADGADDSSGSGDSGSGDSGEGADGAENT